MLTSFFSKSKPINFIVAAIYMMVFYFFARFSGFMGFSFSIFLKEIVVLLLFVFSMVVLNFIAKRNELTGRNAYKTILFAAFACMFFQVLGNSNVLIANLFVLLALRRIISLKSQRQTAQKIFDATLWICIASLFYFWTILFLGLVFIGILLHVGQDYKNWLIPFVAFLTVLSLATSLDLLMTNTFYTYTEWFQQSNFDFSAYRELYILAPITFLLTLTIWCSFFYINVLQKTSSNLKASLILVLFAALFAFGVAIFAPTKNSSELLFLFAPLAIVVTNYFQVMKDKWFKEVLLWAIILMPVFLMTLF